MGGVHSDCFDNHSNIVPNAMRSKYYMSEGLKEGGDYSNGKAFLEMLVPSGASKLYRKKINSNRSTWHATEFYSPKNLEITCNDNSRHRMECAYTNDTKVQPQLNGYTTICLPDDPNVMPTFGKDTVLHVNTLYDASPIGHPHMNWSKFNLPNWKEVPFGHNDGGAYVMCTKDDVSQCPSRETIRREAMKHTRKHLPEVALCMHPVHVMVIPNDTHMDYLPLDFHLKTTCDKDEISIDSTSIVRQHNWFMGDDGVFRIVSEKNNIQEIEQVEKTVIPKNVGEYSTICMGKALHHCMPTYVGISHVDANEYPLHKFTDAHMTDPRFVNNLNNSVYSADNILAVCTEKDIRKCPTLDEHKQAIHEAHKKHIPQVVNCDYPVHVLQTNEQFTKRANNEIITCKNDKGQSRRVHTRTTKPSGRDGYFTFCSTEPLTCPTHLGPTKEAKAYTPAWSKMGEEWIDRVNENTYDFDKTYLVCTKKDVNDCPSAADQENMIRDARQQQEQRFLDECTYPLHVLRTDKGYEGQSWNVDLKLPILNDTVPFGPSSKGTRQSNGYYTQCMPHHTHTLHRRYMTEIPVYATVEQHLHMFQVCMDNDVTQCPTAKDQQTLVDKQAKENNPDLWNCKYPVHIRRTDQSGESWGDNLSITCGNVHFDVGRSANAQKKAANGFYTFCQAENYGRKRCPEDGPATIADNVDPASGSWMTSLGSSAPGKAFHVCTLDNVDDCSTGEVVCNVPDDDENVVVVNNDNDILSGIVSPDEEDLWVECYDGFDLYTNGMLMDGGWDTFQCNTTYACQPASSTTTCSVPGDENVLVYNETEVLSGTVNPGMEDLYVACTNGLDLYANNTFVDGGVDWFQCNHTYTCS